MLERRTEGMNSINFVSVDQASLFGIIILTCKKPDITMIKHYTASITGSNSFTATWSLVYDNNIKKFALIPISRNCERVASSYLLRSVRLVSCLACFLLRDQLFSLFVGELVLLGNCYARTASPPSPFVPPRWASEWPCLPHYAKSRLA